MTTIALHGNFASGKILARDMGYPLWVHGYMNKFDIQQDLFTLSRIPNLFLIGYSYGGYHISQMVDYLPNLKGVILYESPSIDKIHSEIPVLQIWNSEGRFETRAAQHAINVWSQQEDYTLEIGKGRHTKFCWGWPPIGHGWDKSLNPKIASWIKERSYA